MSHLDSSGLSRLTSNLKDRLVPSMRKINGKSLNTDITLSPADIGAASFVELAAKADKTQLSNPNILHNWDFRYSPSIVNQRGSESYVSTGGIKYSIDRWRTGNSGKVVLNPDSITLTSSGDIFEFTQLIENYSSLNKHTLTLSVEVNGSIYYGTNVVDTEINSTPISVPIASTGYSLQLRIIPTSAYFGVRLFSSVAGKTVTLTRIKLEVGSISTLANDPPVDYGVELAKCQRYFLRLGGSGITKPANGYMVSPTTFVVVVPLPRSMRIAPTVVASSPISNITAQKNPPADSPVATSVTRDGNAHNNAVALAILLGTPMDIGTPANLRLTNGAYIDLDANL